jgi:hypothetical protein
MTFNSEEAMRKARLQVRRWCVGVTEGSLLMVLTACVLSIEPLIPESESVFEPALLGTWALEGEGDTATFRRAGETGYVIDYIDGGGEHGRFEGRIGWLGEHMLLEVAPVLPEMDASDGYTALLLTGKVWFVVTAGNGEVRAAQVEGDSLRAHLARGDLWTPHLRDVVHGGGGNDHLLLTGTTAELRTWLARYLERPGVLAETAVWKRTASE